MKKLIVVLFCLLAFSTKSFAQSRSAFTYDLSGGVGTYNGNSYTEIDFGLNWWMKEWLNWRNSIFTQFGSTIKSVYGLDTSLIFQGSLFTEGRGFGIDLFAGPGLRFASEDSNGAFGKAGLVFNFGGLSIGGGAQVTHYYNTRTDKDDVKLPDDEVQYFIILSGGGSF
ncbi:hypothetical protein [Bdellovibrio svalbardensis]|uniref:Outer membrane protein beta-barrel domain-containing protein n=1 Tax=Bdellovibrio svalbardensis TaxID=2972972 RepID=A0ABT6DGU1_9BACT|nr:hypothetical protein [Bdellovibrio svalbardensis]MDG0815687.1 hypothetical protein [Bdellovibrio svalbardensis]